ncbi:MAG: site-2 protease family protein [Actinobacteria bacterium]|nr:MAG: site-2 protease family protein [Actinomycetota bacterium]
MFSKCRYSGKPDSMIPFGSFRIGRIYGIDIEINYTWFIIFALVTAALAFSYFPTVYPSIPPAINLINGFLTSILFFGSVLFHEMMHSIVAMRNGLKISKITLFIFGGVSQMTGEPDTPGVEFRMALAGPMSSFFLSFIFAGIFILSRNLNSQIISAPFGWLAIINFVLAAFNLFPGFPLDGGRVFRATLWYFMKDIKRATLYASRLGQAFAYTLIFLGLLMVFRGLLDGLWLVLIGWFLNNAAQGSYQQLVLRTALEDVKVKDVMNTEVESLSPNTTLSQAVNDFFLKFKKARFPVAEQGDLLGSITLNNIKKVPEQEWDNHQVKEVTEPVSTDKVTEPETGASDALMQMSTGRAGNLFVVENNHLLGFINRNDILRLLRLRTSLKRG